jgi:hypothetical protein
MTSARDTPRSTLRHSGSAFGWPSATRRSTEAAPYAIIDGFGEPDP